jgi:hypothetical protein
MGKLRKRVVVEVGGIREKAPFCVDLPALVIGIASAGTREVSSL